MRISIGEFSTNPGSFDTVLKVVDKRQKKFVTVKKSNQIQMEFQMGPAAALKEMSIFQTLKHPNIVDLEAQIFQDTTIIVFIFEWCLYQWILMALICSSECHFTTRMQQLRVIKV